MRLWKWKSCLFIFRREDFDYCSWCHNHPTWTDHKLWDQENTVHNISQHLYCHYNNDKNYIEEDAVSFTMDCGICSFFSLRRIKYTVLYLCLLLFSSLVWSKLNGFNFTIHPVAGWFGSRLKTLHIRIFWNINRVYTWEKWAITVELYWHFN